MRVGRILAGLVLLAVFAAAPGTGARAEVSLPLPKGLPGLEGLPLPGGGMDLKLPITLEADTLSYDEDTGVALAEGNVVVGFGDRRLRADRIRYDARTGDASLKGHVHYRFEGDEFSFEQIDLNIESQLGVLYDGTIHIRTNNYQIASERFEKTGPRTFVIRKGSLTTCPCDPIPDWKFEIGRSRVTIDEYAVGKDITFRIRNVPVLWLPWAAFPVKLTRQSGLLMPAFGQTKTRGYFFQLPFYWAINRWSDATVTLEAMSLRGYRPEVEYRFVLNPDSEGVLRATGFRDRKTDKEMYRFHGENLFRLGAWTGNARWDYAHDNTYYRDFVDPDILRTARHVASSAFLSNDGDDDSHALAVRWTKDLQGLPGPDVTVQRLPDYSGTFLPRSLWRTGVDLQGSAGGAWFYRDGGERVLQGQGMLELSRPLALAPSVFFTPYAGVEMLGARTTGKEAGEGSDGGRVLPTGGVLLTSTAWRDFERPGRTNYIHSVTPSFRFRWVPDVDQAEIPLTDSRSRIGARNQVTLSIAQGLHRVVGDGMPVELADLEVEWAYDIGGRKAPESPYVDPLSPYVRALRDQIDLNAGRPGNDRAASDILARFSVQPRLPVRATGEMLFDPVDGVFTSMGVTGEWRMGRETRAAAGYRVSRDLSEDIRGEFSAHPVRLIALEGVVDYSIRNRQLTEGTATVSLYPRSDCWSVGLKLRRTSNPDDTSFKLVFSLKGIGGVGSGRPEANTQ